MNTLNLAIIDSFNSTSHKLSYSKFKNMSTCELSWFFSNFVKSDSTQLDHRYAIPGVIIQRLFQEIVNKKIYLKYKSTSKFNLWIKENVFGLFEFIYFPLDSQYDSNINSLDYYKSSDGQHRLLAIKDKYKLFEIQDDLSPKFADIKSLLAKHSDIEAYLNSLIHIIVINTSLFVQHTSINLSKTVSEVYFKYTLDDLVLSGQLDFISLDYTKDPYILVDGKLNINGYVDSKQLVFYSYLIYKLHNTIPDKAGFFSWKTSEFKEVAISTRSFIELETSLRNYLNRRLEIKDILESFDESLELSSLSYLLQTSPSFTNCQFCPIKHSCKFSKNNK